MWRPDVFLCPGTWLSYLTHLLSLRLAGTAGARNYMRSSFSQWELGIIWGAHSHSGSEELYEALILTVGARNYMRSSFSQWELGIMWGHSHSGCSVGARNYMALSRPGCKPNLTLLLIWKPCLTLFWLQNDCEDDCISWAFVIPGTEHVCSEDDAVRDKTLTFRGHLFVRNIHQIQEKFGFKNNRFVSQYDLQHSKLPVPLSHVLARSCSKAKSQCPVCVYRKLSPISLCPAG